MATFNRIKQVSDHLIPVAKPAPLTRVGVKDDDDIVIVSAVRTAITRARRGQFKDTPPEDLLAEVLKAILARTGVDPNLVDDVCVGTALAPLGGAMTARQACLYAGLPERSSAYTLNRQCSSGLQAVVSIADSIRSGRITIGIGAGMESMSKHYNMNFEPSEKLASHPAAADCLLPMGMTSENVAEQFGITREQQDRLAAESHARAARAQREGLFKDEIIPVTTTVLDKEGNPHTVEVTADEGIREGTTVESLGRLKPSFSKTGTTHAGNASQVSDGAAAVLLMKRKTAHLLKLPVQGKLVSSAVVGVPPRIMGIGPAYAIPKACELAGISVKDVDVFELNEAFASQATFCIQKLGLDPAKVNPKGGAIALGHPLGCTGSRLIATILPELKRQGKTIGAVTMCIGTGMGMCAIIERE
ncbi:3-ketoacyl-CoA thiolase with broad chain length specificity [Tieghemiomyces parasiticus]|uniref:3-ketoacyl-CoA thiolase with broad chain length specificity n=1 Tax=Tieghemiomyces parasiticus TaxID=78921 RepID=A0A9W8DZ56_9FUNG|nr:3-ketoacyl-CoA thiolase with broad chain length specificity [Tieghemiomyces parasiticus]KAJ1926192.1 3-ketoacyl-CoA thiolase with broad chain length specificity [Tieghemiomyces parasiticus]